MIEPAVKIKHSCRRVLAGTAAATVRSALDGDAKNLPPSVPDWTGKFGNGVRAYGRPSMHENDVTRRSVSRLTATPEPPVSFTPLLPLDGIIAPNSLCRQRQHTGIAEVAACHGEFGESAARGWRRPHRKIQVAGQR